MHVIREITIFWLIGSFLGILLAVINYFLLNGAIPH